jgi:hypothetical protein
MSPEWQLAEEMRRDLRVTVSPYELRMFIKYRWDHISKLAHEIHEAGL